LGMGETKAMMQEPANLAATSGSALAGLLLAEMQPRIKDLMKQQQNAWKHDQAGYRGKVLGACRSAVEALSKVPPEEALAYKKWVLAIGLKVAEAAKEHGVAVSDLEKAALAELSGALGSVSRKKYSSGSKGMQAVRCRNLKCSCR